MANIETRGCGCGKTEARIMKGNRRLIATILGALVGTTSSACLVAHEDNAPSKEGSIGVTRAAVIGGRESDGHHDAVLLLRAVTHEGTFSDCTATLLSPNVVLTAKHCVASVTQGNFVCRGDGKLMQDGTGAGTFGDTYEPSSIAFYRGVFPEGEPIAYASKVFTTNAQNACRDDVAILTLDKPIYVPQYPSIRLDGKARVGETVSLIGYGLGESTSRISRREVESIRIVDVGTTDAIDDDPWATTPPRSFVVGGRSVCFGDSGAPALATATGAVVGVYSRITGDCFASESRNTLMMPASFRGLIMRAFAETKELPREEGEGTNFLSTTASGEEGDGGLSSVNALPGESGANAGSSDGSAGASSGGSGCSLATGRSNDGARTRGTAMVSALIALAVLRARRAARCD